MNVADELKKLQELHQSGALSDEEFAAGMDAVFAGGATANEIECLDREWQLERERYTVTGKLGKRYFPSRAMSFLYGLANVGFGIVWITYGASTGAPFHFLLLGVLAILGGFAVSAYLFSRAIAHERAFERYQRRRAMVFAKRREIEPELGSEQESTSRHQ